MNNDKEDHISILYEITGLNSDGLGYFNLDNDDYTCFPLEKEILLCDGLDFIVKEIIPD